MRNAASHVISARSPCRGPARENRFFAGLPDGAMNARIEVRAATTAGLVLIAPSPFDDQTVFSWSRSGFPFDPIEAGSR
jgi:hypothetical protein